jgi:hypothetical protein
LRGFAREEPESDALHASADHKSPGDTHQSVSIAI